MTTALSQTLRCSSFARKSSGFHAEAPARIEQRNYRYTRASKTLAALTDRTPIYTPARWAEGLGHSQSPACFILPSGRAVLIFSVLDSASGTFTVTSAACTACITTRRSTRPHGRRRRRSSTPLHLARHTSSQIRAAAARCCPQTTPLRRAALPRLSIKTRGFAAFTPTIWRRHMDPWGHALDAG